MAESRRLLANQGQNAVLCGLILALIPISTVTNKSAQAAPMVAGYERLSFQREPSVEAGEVLLVELSCAACHALNEGDVERYPPKRGPRLDGIGQRVTAEWLRTYLADPHTVKPQTTMPNVLVNTPDETKANDIEALVHFLMTQQLTVLPELNVKPRSTDDPTASSLQRGADSYRTVGCVACHEPRSQNNASRASVIKEPEDDGRVLTTVIANPAPTVPLGNLSKKYDHLTLTRFLLAPLSVRPAGRMPDMKLGVLEAADIAHFLLRARTATQKSTFQPISHLVDEGRQRFRSKGCVNCHDLPGTEALSKSAPIRLGEDGCLVDSATSGVDYRLTSHQQASLLRALESQASPTSVITKIRRKMAELNCWACHARYDAELQRAIGGVGRHRRRFFETDGQVDFGDEGRIPPSLTNVGAKLTQQGFQDVLTGRGDVRPHMLAQMPVFGKSNLNQLHEWLLEVDGSEPNTKLPTADDHHDVGRELLNQGCVQCHSINGETMPGVVGVDLTNLENRLQPSWFRSFLLNPEQIKPRTRMPTLFRNGRSVVRDILDGDAESQVAAMWTYLRQTEGKPLPSKLEAAAATSFELTPTNEPILFRTFMRKAGTHALAVGFPQGVHLAFDADQVRLAIAWRGQFLDAHGTWFDRFAPPAEPLSDDLLSLPSVAPLAILNNKNAPWPETTDGYRWRGYRLDSDGVPEFLYNFADYRISERLVPTDDGKGLRRRLRVDGTGTRLWFLIATKPMAQEPVKIRLVGKSFPVAKVGDQLRVPIRTSEDSPTDVEVEYRW